MGEREEKGISQEAVSSVSGVQGGGSVEYVSRPLSALPIATLYKGSASIHSTQKQTPVHFIYRYTETRQAGKQVQVYRCIRLVLLLVLRESSVVF